MSCQQECVKAIAEAANSASRAAYAKAAEYFGGLVARASRQALDHNTRRDYSSYWEGVANAFSDVEDWALCEIADLDAGIETGREDYDDEQDRA